MRMLTDEEREVLLEPDDLDFFEEEPPPEQLALLESMEACGRLRPVKVRNEEWEWEVSVNTEWGKKALRIDALMREKGWA